MTRAELMAGFEALHTGSDFRKGVYGCYLDASVWLVWQSFYHANAHGLLVPA